jgi:hypothetical protein
MLCTGWDISSLAGRLPVSTCLSIVQQLLQALAWLHMHGFAGFDMDAQHIFYTITEKNVVTIRCLPVNLSYQLCEDGTAIDSYV